MDLHAEIMNIQRKPPETAPQDWAWQDGYRLGHRDARHAAAELALSSLSTIKEMREALSHLYAASHGTSDDEISARLRARSVLTKYPETNK